MDPEGRPAGYFIEHPLCPKNLLGQIDKDSRNLDGCCCFVDSCRPRFNWLPHTIKGHLLREWTA